MSEQSGKLIQFNSVLHVWDGRNTKKIGSWPYLELKLQAASIHISPEIFEQ